MNLQKNITMRMGVPLLGLALFALAYRAYGWAGVAVAASGVVMWALLHFNRLVQVLKRASNRPVGFVDSAVMLNAKLKPGATLLHVVALTKALGELKSPPEQQPELYRWTDGGASHVTCEFRDGQLVKWELFRPEPDAGAP